MKRKKWILISLPVILFFLLAATYDMDILKRIDTAVITAMTGLRSEMLTPFFTLLTNIGSWYVTAPAWLVLTAVLLVNRAGWTALFLTGVFWGSRFFNWLLKENFARPRPEVDHLVSASHFSFPSGHAMNSMAFYGFLLLLAGVYIKESKMLAYTVQLFLGLLILLIGMSRLYLGVHYFTDVTAGFCAGFVWMYALFCLYQRVEIEKRRKKHG